MGSIQPYYNKQGKKLYRVRYEKPDRKQTQKRGFRLKRDAEEFLATIEVSKLRGEFIAHTAGRATIAELGRVWLSHQTHLKASTLRTQESAWRNHVEPAWGTWKVGDIQHSDVQAWISAMTGSPTTVIRNHQILSAILENAIRDRRITANPASHVNLPRKTGRRKEHLTHLQVEALAAEAGEHATLVYVLAYSGLRWGEAAGLRVRDVDLAARRLQVSNNAVMVGGKIVEDTTKSGEPRVVPFPEFLTDRLVTLLEGRPHDGLVFGNGQVHIKPSHSHRGWLINAVRRCQKVDPLFPRVTAHNLRHTAASLAASSKVNPKVVQRILGHKDARVTLDIYTHLNNDDLDDASAGLDRARSRAIMAK